jgi:hypothetical protein
MKRTPTANFHGWQGGVLWHDRTLGHFIGCIAPAHTHSPPDCPLLVPPPGRAWETISAPSRTWVGFLLDGRPAREMMRMRSGRIAAPQSHAACRRGRSAGRLRPFGVGRLGERRLPNPRMGPTSAGRRTPPLRLLQPRIRLRRRSPHDGEGTPATCCLSGTGALPVDGEMTRERCLARVPGKGMSGQAEVYRPLAGGEVACTSPSAVSTGRPGGRVNARFQQAAVVPDPNDCPPRPPGDMPSVDGPGSNPGKAVPLSLQMEIGGVSWRIRSRRS